MELKEELLQEDGQPKRRVKTKEGKGIISDKKL